MLVRAVLVLHVVLATGCAVVGSDRSVGNWLYPVVTSFLGVLPFFLEKHFPECSESEGVLVW